MTSPPERPDDPDPPDPPDEVAAAVGDAALAHDLRIAVVRLARRIRAARVDATLSLSQLSALAVIDARGPLGAGDLAGFEAVQPPTMSKIVAALVDRGFVSRTPDPDDGRAVRLAVTPAGHVAVEAERRARDAWFGRELERLPPADRARLRGLGALLDRIGTDDDHPI